MTKLFAVLLLAAGALAQDFNATVFDQLSANFTAAGFTELVKLVTAARDTTHGMSACLMTL